jgi:hypothetical protein
MTSRMAAFGVALASLALVPAVARAQSGAPRNYQLGPVGVTTVFVNLVGTASDTAADTELGLPSNVALSRNGSVTVLRSFPLGEKYGGVAFTAARATVEPTSGGPQTSGFTDPAFTFHVNLFGGPALEREKFSTFVPVTYSSFHLTVNAPLGSYDRNAAVNTGANRWVVSPLINYSITPDKGASWIDLYAGGQFFSANNEYRGNNKLTQSPLGTFTVYYTRNIVGSIWAGLGAYYRTGGETSINGVSEHNALGGLRPSAVISGKLDKVRFTLRYDATTVTPESRTRSGLISLQINFPPF